MNPILKNRRKKTNLPYSTRLLSILLKVTVLILSLHFLMQYLNLEVFYQQNGQIYELANRFDLDDESSVPTWFSQILFLLISLGALLAAYFQTNNASRNLWRIIAGIGLLFSLDEATTLHEYILQTLHVLFFKDASPTGQHNAWWLVAPFVLAAGAWLIWKALRLLPRQTVTLFMTAGFTFLAGAFVVDMITSTAYRETFLNQGILVAIEESFELLGTVIALYAIADYLETYHYESINAALKQLRYSRPSKQ